MFMVPMRWYTHSSVSQHW